MCGCWQIIKRANEIGENPLDLSNRFCQEYITDMTSLQCLPPTHQPRVSDHMEQIKDMISQVLFSHSLITLYLLCQMNAPNMCDFHQERSMCLTHICTQVHT